MTIPGGATASLSHFKPETIGQGSGLAVGSAPLSAPPVDVDPSEGESAQDGLMVSAKAFVFGVEALAGVRVSIFYQSGVE